MWTGLGDKGLAHWQSFGATGLTKKKNMGSFLFVGAWGVGAGGADVTAAFTVGLTVTLSLGATAALGLCVFCWLLCRWHFLHSRCGGVGTANLRTGVASDIGAAATLVLAPTKRGDLP